MPRGAGVPTKAPKPSSSSGLFSRNILKTKPVSPSVDALPTQDSGFGGDHTLQAVRNNGAIDNSQALHQPDPIRPATVQGSPSRSPGSIDELDTLAHLEINETGIDSPTTSRDASDISSADSTSVYSTNSSSLGETPSSKLPGDLKITETTQTTETITSGTLHGVQYQESVHSVAVRRTIEPPQDDATRERSTLAKKAALFKNSRLPPQLPSFNASLFQWSLICRAAQASCDSYGPASQIRRGTYTAASKKTKALILDEQTIDGTQVLIVAIRGTAINSLVDWSTNNKGKLTKPTGFLDDEENSLHDGFLQVSRAMVSMVAAQLQDNSAQSNESHKGHSITKPALLFTGHSAGGAVATMLYCHMLSKVVSSELTALASQFASINCITFGAPPVSLTPLLPSLDDSTGAGGMFLTFANEGDPVCRTSNTAYIKSLVQLMTASTSASVPQPPVKVVHRSRGSAPVYKPPPAVPWEELPLWPTPAASLVLCGHIVLLRDGKTGVAEASTVTCEDLKDVIFADLEMHSCLVYIQRVKEAALCALTGMTLE